MWFATRVEIIIQAYETLGRIESGIWECGKLRLTYVTEGQTCGEGGLQESDGNIHFEFRKLMSEESCPVGLCMVFAIPTSQYIIYIMYTIYRKSGCNTKFSDFSLFDELIFRESFL